MDLVFSFVVTVAAGVVCHLICKWLDSDKQSVTSLWIKPPYKTEQKSPGIRGPWAFRCVLPKWQCFLFAYWHYSICKISFQDTSKRKICPNPYVMDEEKWKKFKTAIAAPQQEPRWVKDDKGWWYQNADRIWAKSEWRLINHHWYLFGANGYIRKGWHRWNPDTKQVDPDDGSGDWYYLQETGDLEGTCWYGTEKGSLEIWYVKQKSLSITIQTTGGLKTIYGYKMRLICQN